MKQVIVIFKAFIIIAVLLITMNSTVQAKESLDEGEEIVTEGLWGWMLQDDDITMDTDIKIGNSGAEESSKEITERLLGIVQVIGSVVSVIALLIIGFRYMFSSLEEKANMKGILIYYVIGAVLVFATSNVLSVVYKVITSLN